MAGALVTDLYELKMAASYLRRGLTAPATCSLFVRRLPPGRGFLVAAGLEDCLAWLEGWSFGDGELAWLREQGFTDGDVEAFTALRFTGDVWAVPEGTVVLPDEPLLEVTAPLPEAQLVETFLLNQVTFQTAVATKAARCRVAAAGRIALADFALRRTHGAEAGMAVARLTAMAGFTGTSNVEAARRFGLQAVGTMAHSYVEVFASEADAFDAFATDFPGGTTLLVDTYDTLEGVRRAIEVVRRHGLGSSAAVRLDSGDLAGLAVEARRLLDGAGLADVRIFASGSLDEYELEALVQAGAPIDAAGVGTRMGVSADAPYVDSVYKLVEYDGRGVRKLAEGKSTLPGAKQVFRGAEGDLLALRDEPAPPGARPLLERVMVGGRRTRPAPSIADLRRAVDDGLAGLPPAALALRDPTPPPVAVSDRLRRHADDVTAAIHSRSR